MIYECAGSSHADCLPDSRCVGYHCKLIQKEVTPCRKKDGKLSKVSTLGRVMNGKTGKLLNPYDDGQGYLRVKVDGCNARLHILVATAFCSHPEGKNIVNHKRGKKHDCRASQLEWVTQSENIQHAWNIGLCGRGG